MSDADSMGSSTSSSDVKDTRLHSVERWTLGLGAAVTILAFVWFGRDIGLGVSIGAGIMALNAIAMRRVGEKIWSALKDDTAGGRARPLRAILLLNLKMGGLIAVVYLVITYLHVHAIALLVGLSVYPLAALAVALTHVTPTVTPVEDHHG